MVASAVGSPSASGSPMVHQRPSARAASAPPLKVSGRSAPSSGTMIAHAPITCADEPNNVDHGVSVLIINRPVHSTKRSDKIFIKSPLVKKQTHGIVSYHKR